MRTPCSIPRRYSSRAPPGCRSPSGCLLPPAHAHAPLNPSPTRANTTRLACGREGVRAHARKGSDADSQPDMIERAVSFLFGKKALEDPEPMGMKRINFDELPDQEVELDRLAAPLAEDSGDVTFIRPLLAGTQLEKEPLSLQYQASVDGWTPQAFHRKVDDSGAAIVLVFTGGGAVAGGYNPEGWIGLGEDRYSMGAFLFSWPDGDTSKPAAKLPKIGGPNLAVMDKPDTGPWFGAEGLTIPLRRNSEKIAKSRLGTYYARRPDNGRSLFAESDDPKKTVLTEIKVYAASTKPTWRLDGGFALKWTSEQGKASGGGES